MEVIFDSLAASEYEEALGHYAAIDPRLSQQLIDRVQSALEILGDRPWMFRIFEPPFRRLNPKQFPYALIYVIESDRLRVIAFMHGRRQPAYWKHRDAGE